MAVRTLERSYLLRDGDKIFERPQYMFLRVAIGIHGPKLMPVLETYDLLSKMYYTHASPTLFHAGTTCGQLSSCFLLPLDTTSPQGTHATLSECATISREGGGIGLSVTQHPALGETRKRRQSHGITPVLQLFDASLAITEQSENKRPGAIAVYLEPWHLDIVSFLDMRRNRGNDAKKGRRLFYALWIPDIFMQRVRSGETWSLFSPGDVPDLLTTFGERFNKAYNMYEKNAKARREIPARTLWKSILECQIETGGPFMLYKDAVNAKSNQQHLGIITHSNLCTEIVQYSTAHETATCNLASLVLPSYVTKEKFLQTNKFDFDELHRVTKIVVKNLNRVMDVTTHPTPAAQLSDTMHRAIGVGIQGLSDTLIALDIPYESPLAVFFSTNVMETMYHAALEASCDLVDEYGNYPSYTGSPISHGQLQFDLWKRPIQDSRYNWTELRERIKTRGLANSLLIALMPTAMTSQLTGCIEGFEPMLRYAVALLTDPFLLIEPLPWVSNIYTRRVLSGDYQMLSPQLVDRLEKHGLWSNEIRLKIMAERGSVQNIPELPDKIRQLFKTAWEISPTKVIEHAAARAPFVDQSQSMSLFVANPDIQKLTSIHFYAWGKGLKTGMYYLHSRAAAEAIPYTIPINMLKRNEDQRDRYKGAEERPKQDLINCDACTA
ncbi:hypothetical protein CVT26_004086 [Gymnopilus dilepis]|uniref:Ribonucleoside-diphosphate reductase n=1 Tax=Gymnopilus dilepis TaxID=231916 RepID=A0A409W284_9AGAR|nr:hypothetical protein CVT26_004086 [Gymnopilus dilepis]